MRLRDLIFKSRKKQDVLSRINELVRYECAPSHVEHIVIPFERDYSNPQDSRVRVKSENDTLTVEEFGLQRFLNKGYKGIHSENSLWESLIFFIFWDHLLSSHAEDFFVSIIPDQFWRRVPPDVYLRTIEQFFESKHSLSAKVEANFEKYLNWSFAFTVDKGLSDSPQFQNLSSQINQVIDSFDLKQLLLLIHTLIKAGGTQITGMPDLLLFENKVPVFCEVKSPNDLLRPAQNSQIESLTQRIGIKVMVADLVEQEPADAHQQQAYHDIRKKERTLRTEAKQRLEQTLGMKVTSAFLPPIPYAKFDSYKLMNIIHDSRIAGYKYLRNYITDSMKSLNDTTVNQSFVDVLNSIFREGGIEEHWLEICMSSYTETVERNRLHLTEKYIVNGILATRELEANDRVQAIAKYNEYLKTILRDVNLQNRLPSYVTVCFVRLSILYEREKMYQDCLDVISRFIFWLEYDPATSEGQVWRRATKKDWENMVKRRERVTARKSAVL